MPLKSNHSILGGKVQLYRRGDGGPWWCFASVEGKQRRATTREENLALARNAAEDWYLELRGKSRAGIFRTEKTCRQVADQFTKEYGIITEANAASAGSMATRSASGYTWLPFSASSASPRSPQARSRSTGCTRATTPPVGGRQPVKMTKGEVSAYKPPSRSALHDETLRPVLKIAIRHAWLYHLPDLSPPYRTQGKIVHRPWFSDVEYKQLYNTTREYARTAREDHRWEAEQLHDLVLFLGNTELRPDEARNLEHRDVAIEDEDVRRSCKLKVRGKLGVGYCKSMPAAVLYYQRLRDRPKPAPSQTKRARRRRGEDVSQPAPPPEFQYPEPTDKVFPGNPIKMFNNLLTRAKLKLDRDGKPRTLYSLRHTYICLRLMEGADISRSPRTAAPALK
jgi:integrase